MKQAVFKYVGAGMLAAAVICVISNVGGYLSGMPSRSILLPSPNVIAQSADCCASAMRIRVFSLLSTYLSLRAKRSNRSGYLGMSFGQGSCHAATMCLRSKVFSFLLFLGNYKVKIKQAGSSFEELPFSILNYIFTGH